MSGPRAATGSNPSDAFLSFSDKISEDVGTVVDEVGKGAVAVVYI